MLLINVYLTEIPHKYALRTFFLNPQLGLASYFLPSYAIPARDERTIKNICYCNETDLYLQVS